LFVDFQRQARLRLNGNAFIQDDDPLLKHWPEAEQALRVNVREMFPDCPRYTHQDLRSLPSVAETSGFKTCGAT
jgi:hypothetical protein